MSTPRGIRNHNPGNIRRTGDKWFGMAKDQSADSEFVVFKKPEFGIRALAKVLLRYQQAYDIRTVHGLIHRWAPPTENDTGAYARHVAKLLGVDQDDEVDVTQYAVMRPLVEAIITHENGQQPYADDVIGAGLLLAGVSEPWPI
jgi:hypothetical protein